MYRRTSTLLTSRWTLWSNKSNFSRLVANHQPKCSTIQHASCTLLELHIKDIFIEEVDKLRQICFPSKKPILSSKDEFDTRSQHVIVNINNVIAAYGRLTPGPNAVFEKWTRNTAQIPTGKEVMDLGRCLVSPQYRSLGLFEVVCLGGLLHAKNLGYKYVVGSYIPGEKVGDKLHKLGFEKSGKIVFEDEPNEDNVLVQPIVCEVDKMQHLWPQILKEKTAFLETKGYLLKNMIPTTTKALDHISNTTLGPRIT